MIVERNRKNKISQFLGKYWIILLIVALVTTTVIAIVEIYKEEVVNPDSLIEYETQNTIYLASETIDTLNPAISKSEDMFNISKLVYDSLFTYNENMQAVPSLVKEYTCNTDRAGIEIVLRDDIYFSDGSQLTNQDVINAITTIRAAGYNSIYYDKVSKITQYYVNYAGNLAIWFNNNYQCSLDDLTFPIFKSKSYGAYTLAGAKSAKPMGTGQYKYGDYDEYNDLSLIPNEYYWGEKAENTIVFNIVPDRNLASNLLKINNVVCYLDDSQMRKSTAIDLNAKAFDIPLNSVDFLVFNASNSEFTNSKEFRKAIVDIIDFNAILSDAYMNDGILTDTIYYPNFYSSKETLANTSAQADIGVSSLKDLGYEDTNEDRYLENKYGKTVKLNIVVNRNNSSRVSAAKLIKKQLDACGIDSEINLLSKEEYDYALSIRNFDILITGYSIAEEYDLRFLFSGDNPWYYYDYNLLTLARNLDRFYTVEEYQTYFDELKKSLLDMNVYVPICYKKMSLVGVDTFEAEKLPMWNNYYKNISTWSWKRIISNNNGESNN